MRKIEDFADNHELISNLFSRHYPTTKLDWEKYRLSDDQVNFFQENGYLHNIKLLEDWQLDILLEELADIQDISNPKHKLLHEFHSNESTDPNTVIFHSLGHWRMTKGFHDILWNPAFVMAASQLLDGCAVRFWHDQLFCKPAKHGGVVAWHQDYSYWTRTIPMNHLTCWVGLDDSTAENGCLQYVPKSHKWGLLDKPILTGEMDGLKAMLSEKQKTEFNNLPIEMKKGYGSFHHPLLVHGSFENFSNRPRRAFVLNVIGDGVISNSDKPLMQEIPVIPTGEKVEGKYFPLLFDSKAH